MRKTGKVGIKREENSQRTNKKSFIRSERKCQMKTCYRHRKKRVKGGKRQFLEIKNSIGVKTSTEWVEV